MHSSAGYNASKAALSIWGESLEMELARAGRVARFTVTIVEPGLFESGMTRRGGLGALAVRLAPRGGQPHRRRGRWPAGARCARRSGSRCSPGPSAWPADGLRLRLLGRAKPGAQRAMNAAPQPPCLIVNADDYGYFRCVSRGILAGARQGIVTATGVFANAPDLAEQAAWLRECDELDTGVHLNLTDGVPLTRRYEGKALARWAGRFPRKFSLAAAVVVGVDHPGGRAARMAGPGRTLPGAATSAEVSEFARAHPHVAAPVSGRARAGGAVRNRSPALSDRAAFRPVATRGACCAVPS